MVLIKFVVCGKGGKMRFSGKGELEGDPEDERKRQQEGF